MSKKSENELFAKNWINKVNNDETWKSLVSNSINKTITRRDVLISSDEIAYCKSNTHNIKPYEVKLTSMKTHEVISNIDLSLYGKTCVLNFASYFSAGGGFTKGSFNQEESLCSISGLYNVLSKLSIYDERSKYAYVPPEYTDEIVYSEDVPFTDELGECDNVMLLDVVSCPAPNCNRIKMADMSKYFNAIKTRTEAIYLLPYLHGCRTLILGAWGCGTLKNDVKVIAESFAKLCKEFPNLYKNVIFACGNSKIKDEFSVELSKYGIWLSSV